MPRRTKAKTATPKSAAPADLDPAAVRLAHEANPDLEYYGRPRGYWAGVPGAPKFEFARISSFKEAAQKVNEYIAKHGLGAGNWSGGQIYNAAGQQIAQVSYNGRVWWGKGYTSDAKEIQINPRRRSRRRRK